MLLSLQERLRLGKKLGCLALEIDYIGFRCRFQELILTHLSAIEGVV